MKKITAVIPLIIFIALAGAGCAKYPTATRESKIPADAVKMTPALDELPPVMHSSEYESPMPMDGPINTAGGEDSGFFAIDRNEFYFFFTPDVSVPVEKQILDEVTGIYVSRNIDGQWQEPERVWLQKPGKLAGDGCEYVRGNIMWFCSVREGFAGVNLFTAEFKNNQWKNWRIVEDKLREWEVGEMHITSDGKELYFHSPREGGKGEFDIWVTKNVNGEWQEPENIEIVNSETTDGWPYVTEDKSELWFTRNYRGSPALFRSKRIDNEWQSPEIMISQFAGESSMDSEGNVYFTHHFYNTEGMIEADIYVAKKK